MSRHIPKNYTILISCTGKTPITLTFHPKVVMGLLLTAIAIPTVWLGQIFYSYHQRNSELVNQNDQLNEEASEILNQVEALEAQLEELQERAGMAESEVGDRTPSPEASSSRGGPAHAVSTETLLDVARNRLFSLNRNLMGNVQPALEQTLQREDAQPTGVPLKGTYDFSSPFGVRRNPFGRGYEFHEGMDFTAAFGSPIYATAPGIVTVAEFSGGYGNHVIVEHGYGYRTLYAHLSKIEVRPGMRIDRDRIVGYLGNTGRSSGPHLHYSVYLNDNPVDPARYLE